MENRKIAIVGCGIIGNVHAQVLSEQGYEIAALCDVDEVALTKTKEKFAPNALAYTNYAKMIDEVSPYSVHICTPHHLHAEATIYALNRNIHVLCEKPLAITRESLAAVLEAEKNSKANLGVCQQNRYNDVNVAVKELLTKNPAVYGHGTVTWNRGAWYYAQAAWRGKRATEGGGVIINQALHTFDLMQWMVGFPEELVGRADNFTLQDVIEVEDTVSCVCFTGENRFTFFATNAAKSDLPVEMNFKLKDGSLLTVFPERAYLNGEQITSAEMVKVYGKGCYGTGHTRLIRHFYECAEQGKPFPINGQEGAKVVRMILATYESNGRKVKV